MVVVVVVVAAVIVVVVVSSRGTFELPMRLTIAESYNINNATNNKHDNNHCNKCGNSNEIVNKNSAGLEDQEPRQVKNQAARGIKLRICKATGRQLSSFGLVHPNTQNQGSYAKAVCK